MIEYQTDRRSCTPACGCTRTRTPAAARRGCSRRSRALRADQIGFYPPYAAATRRVRRLSRRRPGSARAGQRARRRDHGARGRLSAAGDRRRRCRKRSCPSRRSRSSAFDTDGRRRPAGAGDAAPGLLLSARRGAGGDHAAHARRLPDQPEQPDRRVDAARRDPRRSRGACRPAPSCSSTRRTPSSPATTLHPRARRVSERHRRPHVLEGVRPRRPADRLPDRRRRTRSTRFGAAMPVYSVNIAAVVAVLAALAGSRAT